MSRIKDPDKKSAYEFSFGLISSQTELDSALELMLKDALLTQWEVIHLGRPNSTYRQRFVVVRDVLTKTPSLLSGQGYKKMPWLEMLQRYINTETQLKKSAGDREVVRQIAGSNGIETGLIQDIKPISARGSINYPFQLITEKGKMFLRYTSALGGDCFLRYEPKETVFRHVLGEKTFKLLIGQDSTTDTLYPSIEHALGNAYSQESDSIEGRISQRILVQSYYADEYIKVQDYKNFGKNLEWMVKTFARINAIVHASTAGINSAVGYGTGAWFQEGQRRFVSSNKGFYRYTSLEEYIEWLNEVNWITHMVKSFRRDQIKKFPQTDVSIIDFYEATRDQMLQDGVDVEKIWSECIESSENFWINSAVLTGPDIKPSNSFFREKDSHIRLYDFDYFAFFDAPYHLGQGLYTVLRFATAREEIYDVTKLLELSGLFVSEYYRNLKIEFQRLGREMPECFKSEEFRKMAYQVGALSFFYVMMHDIKEKNLSSEQQKAVVSLTEVMLR